MKRGMQVELYGIMWRVDTDINVRKMQFARIALGMLANCRLHKTNFYLSYR